jgi:protein-tyrosine phosphatase
VLTPHFYAQLGSPSRFIERRKRASLVLESAIEKLPDAGLELPARILGAEVNYFDELWQLGEEELEGLCIGSTNILMVEMPEDSWSLRVYDSLEKLLYQRRVVPLIAHVDRCMHAITDSRAFEDLIEGGLLVQLNASAFENLRSRRKATRWMRDGLVHRIGSDCHNMGMRRPNIATALQAVQKSFDEQEVRQYFAPVSATTQT